MLFKYNREPPVLAVDQEHSTTQQLGLSLLDLSGNQPLPLQATPLEAPLNGLGVSPIIPSRNGNCTQDDGIEIVVDPPQSNDSFINLGISQIQHPGIENMNNFQRIDFIASDQTPVLESVLDSKNTGASIDAMKNEDPNVDSLKNAESPIEMKAAIDIIPCESSEKNPLILASDSPSKSRKDTEKAITTDVDEHIPPSQSLQCDQSSSSSQEFLPPDSKIVQENSQDPGTRKRKASTDQILMASNPISNSQVGAAAIFKKLKQQNCADELRMADTQLVSSIDGGRSLLDEDICMLNKLIKEVPPTIQTLEALTAPSMTSDPKFDAGNQESLFSLVPDRKELNEDPQDINDSSSLPLESFKVPPQDLYEKKVDSITDLVHSHSQDQKILEAQSQDITFPVMIPDSMEIPISLSLAEESIQEVTGDELSLFSNSEEIENSAENVPIENKAVQNSLKPTKAKTKKGKVVDLIEVIGPSSTEPDDSSDDDYEPTQVSPKNNISLPKNRIINDLIDTDKKIKLKNSFKEVSSAAASRLSSELGSIKKRVRFTNATTPKKKLFTGIDFVISLAANSATLDGNWPAWTKDKDKLSSRIKAFGGTVISDPLKYYDGRRKVKRKTNQMFLITLIPLRTKKFLVALAVGIPILSVTWVEHCLQSEALLDHNSFRLPNGDSLLLSQPCAALPASNGIFKGKTFYVYNGKSSSKDKDAKKTLADWIAILLASEATISSSQDFKKNRNSDYFLILEECLSEKEKDQYSDIVVTPDYVIQCLRHQLILDRKSHDLFTRF